MTRLGAAAPEMCSMIESEFISDCCLGNLCCCGSRGDVSKLDRLVHMYGRCQVLISCLEESLFSVSQSLFGRKRVECGKRTQFDAYRQIIRDCKRILSTVANPLFVVAELPLRASLNLIEELQLVFAKLEVASQGSLVSGSSTVVDTRGILRELGLVSGGLLSAASPDGLFVVMYDALRKAVSSMALVNGGNPIEALEDLLWGCAKWSDEESIDFSHMRLSDTKATTVDKHISAWLSGEEANDQVGFEKIPKILTLQLLHKIKDRLDVNERFRLGHVLGSPESVAKKSLATPKLSWEDFLVHECEESRELVSEEPASAESTDVWFRLHSMLFCWGSDLSAGHYSAVVRNHRMGGWSRFDDSFSEELMDIGGAGGGPDWVFSPEWACCSLLFVREDAIGRMYQRSVDVRLVRPDLFTRAIQRSETGSNCSVLCNRTCPDPSIPASLDPACQVEVCLVTEKDVLSAIPGGFSVPFTFTVPAASTRKLIVRKDIPVNRLMQAVAEHFKIPVDMQRLFALRYYAETGQERFELMQCQRSVMMYMDNQGKLAAPQIPKQRHEHTSSVVPGIPGQSSQLYVLVTASRAVDATTCLVKVLDEKNMGMVSVCTLTMDREKPLREYFSQVISKFNSVARQNLSQSCQFVVFEEVGVRSLELRRSSVAIKTEKIMDGDILVFVPLTDTAKRALITTSLASQAKQSKRRTMLSNAPEAPACAIVEDITESESEEKEESLNDRCRRFLSRVKSEDHYEDMLLDDELMIDDDDSSSNECTDECCGCKEANRLNARIDIVRRYLRQRPEQQPEGKLSEIMSDLMGEMKLFDGMTRDELDKLMFGSKRRLEVPPVLREELHHHPPTNACFYCQLPLNPKQQVKIGCSAACIKQTAGYHERCARELVLEFGGSSACIITEGCRGKIILDSKSPIAKLISKEEVPRMSQAAVRSKLTSVLVTPAVPELNRNGKITLNGKVLDPKFSGKGQAPALPVKKPKKPTALPIESLWWNACLTAFGGFDNVHAAVADGHWDAADLSQAKSVFNFWCCQLLDRKKSKPAATPKVETKKPVVTVVVEASSDSEKESESDSELDAPEPVKPEVSIEFQLVDSSDDDSEGFVVAGKNGRKGLKIDTPGAVETPTTRVATESVNTPSSPVVTSSVVIPQGFLGAPKEVSHEVSILPVEEADAEEAAACIAQQTITSLLDEELFAPPSSISLVESLGIVEDEPVVCSLLESRMNLLPAPVRQYCLPVDLVFVYYSAHFFSGREANTVSMTPPGGDTDILQKITHAAYDLSLAVARLFTSPHQLFPDSPISVQWFVEFQSAQDAKVFSDFIASSCPEWGPETGALLPASMLGFAV
jgi:hypothetical protein